MGEFRLSAQQEQFRREKLVPATPKIPGVGLLVSRIVGGNAVQELSVHIEPGYGIGRKQASGKDSRTAYSVALLKTVEEQILTQQRRGSIAGIVRPAVLIHLLIISKR